MKKIFGAIINLKGGSELFIENSNYMEKTFKKIKKLLERQPSFDTSESGGNEMEKRIGETQLQVITTETTTKKMNTVLSIPSAFEGEIFLAVDPKN